MNYLSVCSGIEAATVAWHHLGWKPLAFSEIEPFPSAVLAHHYPHVTNFGDMTQFKEWNLGKESIDVLVGGTPCQSFSVAGLRKGLADPRGNLMLVYLAIAERFRPKWIVWENVPGVLSSGSGRDFGTFLGALGKLGYGFAFRVLDAQWFGVAQRRRRVFVVGCLGDATSAAKVLFESESVCRNPAPSREKGQGVAARVENRTYWRGGDQANSELLVNQTGTLNCNKGQQGGVLFQPTNMVLKNQNKNLIYHAPITGTLAASDGPKGVSDQYAHEGKLTVWQSVENQTAIAIGTDCYNGTITGDVACTMGTSRSSVNASGPTIMHQMAVRRLTPIECERLQGFPDNYTAIPWRKKPADQCPDGPRYKSLGNSMAVPVMRWIGERIGKVEKGAAP